MRVRVDCFDPKKRPDYASGVIADKGCTTLHKRCNTHTKITLYSVIILACTILYLYVRGMATETIPFTVCTVRKGGYAIYNVYDFHGGLLSSLFLNNSSRKMCSSQTVFIITHDLFSSLFRGSPAVYRQPYAAHRNVRYARTRDDT